MNTSGTFDLDGVRYVVARLAGARGLLFARVDELGGVPAAVASFWIGADMVWFNDSASVPAPVVNAVVALVT